ncbi:MAG: asparagine synthase (glutamine-hydrolyzing), partial [Rhodanobacter sp.]
MCGICGVVALNLTDRPPHMEQRARAMLRHMAHRGPDGEGSFAREKVVIAANRLAIRSVGDQQLPLIEGDDGIIVVCNGEIDNHRELKAALTLRGHDIREHTDVAVIAPLYREYGLSFVDQLQGVFAFALWDPARQRLILARDRAGERHLYYTFADGLICFASELAALVAGRGRAAGVDPTSVARYLRFGYCPSPFSLLQDHQKMRPGEMVVFEPSGTRHLQYWNFHAEVASEAARSLPAFDRVFRSAVQRQSEIDVDYGVLLSGGIDSALLTAVARKLRPEKELAAYCIRFSEASFDEGTQAERLAHQLGCRFVPVQVTAQDFPPMLRQLVETTGEPLADPAWIPLSLVARRASRDVKVVLSGEGADELFAGYPTYLGAHLAGYYARLPAFARRACQYLIERLPPSDRKVTLAFLLKRFIRGQQLDGLARHLLWTASISPGWLQRLGVEPPATDTSHDPAALIDVLQQYDLAQPLPEALLAKADYGGMLHGVEIRAPFLDQTVIEFAATLPVQERVRGLTTKIFLKHYAERYLPRSVITRRKRGLSVPLAAWLRGPLLDWAESQLTHKALSRVGIDQRQVSELLTEHRSRSSDHSRAIWTLIVLSEWLQWLSHSQADLP